MQSSLNQRFVLSALALAVFAVLAACSAKREVRFSNEAPPPPPPEPAPVFVAEDEEALGGMEVTGAPIAAPSAPRASPAPALGIGRVEVPEPATAGTAGETYAATSDNPPLRTIEKPLSTFSIDVDTGSYANVRNLIQNGTRPPADAVRAEEFINYFDYDYPLPTAADPPFSVTTELGVAPWNARHQLLLVGLKGYELPAAQIPKSNLVFLVDVSGSMAEANKLPLLVEAFKLLVDQLDADDSVAIVVYAGAAGMVLPPTSGSDKARIRRALDALSAGGSTNGGQGIRLAYRLAHDAFIAGGINRVILATDGDFNVGTSSVDELKTMIEREREGGVSLTTLGFGRGNYNDEMAEQLADVGNGNHYYIDSLNEARKVLVEQRGSTLFTIARDVKIQIEFNPAVVREYRLIGYTNRRLADQDFADDRKDAGEIGAGHEVTALYELALAGAGGEQLPALRDAPESAAAPPMRDAELAFLKLRYKPPGSDSSRLWQTPVANRSGGDGERLQFAAAVAGFAEVLRGSSWVGRFGYRDVAALAGGAIGRDPYGYRREFLQLVQRAAQL